MVQVTHKKNKKSMCHILQKQEYKTVGFNGEWNIFVSWNLVNLKKKKCDLVSKFVYIRLFSRSPKGRKQWGICSPILYTSQVEELYPETWLSYNIYTRTVFSKEHIYSGVYSSHGRRQNSKPPFNWTDKDGLAILLRGVSKVITNPELPTWPFHFDRPSCHSTIQEHQL